MDAEHAANGTGIVSGRRIPACIALALVCLCAVAAAQAQSTRQAAPTVNGSDRGRVEGATEGSAGAPHPRLERGVFVIAKAGLNDPNFNRSVILITQYDDAGTAGLIINRTLQMPADQMLPPIARLGLDAGELHVGGPVGMNSLQLLIRSTAVLDKSLHVFADVYLINESATLSDLLDGHIPGSAVRLYAGYTGWGPGQLENELLRGDWYLWSGESSEIFSERPEAVWPRLIQQAAAQWALRLAPALTVAQAHGASIMSDCLQAHPAGGRHGPGHRPEACPAGDRVRIPIR